MTRAMTAAMTWSRVASARALAVAGARALTVAVARALTVAVAVAGAWALTVARAVAGVRVVAGVRAVSVAAVGGALILTACGTRQVGGPAGSSISKGAPSTTVTPAGTASAGTVSASPGHPLTVPPSSPASASRKRIVVGRSGKVTLTQSDNGATVVLARGQLIIVALGGPGLPTWDQPLAAGPRASLLHRVSASGGYPSSAPARAQFLAVHPGRSMIRSITDAACLHSKPMCAMAQQVWQVSVIIIAARH